eukprot:TRINITY_DN399_c1_g1_i1.p1 TRINITY_DN399_c1_g1~~TRINITY_DN399_c1_g1_i1.p1  ORF type:complete len:243 (-),score=63.65 TRINITY_DN399_c1_g1_i1:144-818(-)
MWAIPSALNFSQRSLLSAPTPRRSLHTSPCVRGKNQPIYMRSATHRQLLKTKKDADGVPVRPHDYTSHDNTNRPKRDEMQFYQNSNKRMKQFNTWELFNQVDETKGVKLNPPSPIPRLYGVVPEPRNGMTMEKFLKAIGRDIWTNYEETFTSWEHLFRSRGNEMKKLEVAVRDRKYILAWTERYRQGIDPYFMPLKSKSKRNSEIEWKMERITQKALREEYGLE